MTKSILAHQILGIIEGGDVSNDASVTIQEVILAVNQVRDFLVQEDIWARKNVGDNQIPGEYLEDYCVDIQCDDKTNSFYAELPVKPLNLQRNQGVFKVTYTKNQEVAFVPSSSSSSSLYTGLPSFKPQGRQTYYVQGDRLYFPSIKKGDDLQEIYVVLVASTADIGDEDPLPIPADKEIIVVQRVVEMYRQQKLTPQDNVNDNVDA